MIKHDHDDDDDNINDDDDNVDAAAAAADYNDDNNLSNQHLLRPSSIQFVYNLRLHSSSTSARAQAKHNVIMQSW